MIAKRIAYIGCGAVVERSHLPALALSEGFEATLLVDTDRSRLQELQSRYPSVSTTDDYRSSLDKFDIAVVATPAVSHFKIGMELLKAGKHVLMEKPLAVNAGQANSLCELANRKNLLLAVSLVRRYLPHFKLFRSLLQSSIVGELERFEIEEGGIFNWPVQSIGFFDSKRFGGGVLMDHGAHLLDICLWWFGDYTALEYSDDNQGGVEADCRLDLKMQSGLHGSIIMSRLRNLNNNIRVVGKQGSLSMNLATGEITLAPESASLSLVGTPVEVMSTGAHSGANLSLSTVDLFKIQYAALRGAIDGVQDDAGKLVQAEDCLASIALIEQCYANRQPLPRPVW
ncbi:MAG: Gfo/Idh/MocA family oxidoreductase [Gammaproteobacteria bacterium]|nr:Gfo/Idh/MocA family oxidoreductase [Gammaproteobacteria bacterium]